MAGILSAGDIIGGGGRRGPYQVKNLCEKSGVTETYLIAELSSGDNYCLRISLCSITIDSQYRSMKLLNETPLIKLTGLVPRVFLKDSCLINGEIYSFFVMESYSRVTLSKGGAGFINFEDYEGGSLVKSNVQVGILEKGNKGDLPIGIYVNVIGITSLILFISTLIHTCF